MNPAFSVIVFTTLSGAGYGVLAWLGIALLTARPDFFDAGDAAWSHWIGARLFVALLVGIALTAVGLVSSTFHLGKPLRAWRAFSQWRTSWLSREGVLALATWIPAAVLLLWSLSAANGDGAGEGLSMGAVQAVGVAMTLLALATVACTAMIYASLKPVPAWRHPLVVPVYVVFACYTGFLAYAALMLVDWSDHPGEGAILMHYGAPRIAAVLGLATATMKIAYWRAIDRVALPTRAAATALEGFGSVATFERPHTEANYLTREMGFVLARRHSSKLRVIAFVLIAALPLLAFAAAATGGPSLAFPAMAFAAVSALAGAFVERWLFFAEAKHMVTLYY